MKGKTGSSFDMHAKIFIQMRQHPPRMVNLKLLLLSVSNRLFSSIVLFGLLGIFIGLSRLQRGETSWVDNISPLIALIGGVVLLLLPIYRIWYNRNALRFGRFGRAQITAVYNKYAAMAFSIYPLVTGEYRVAVDGEVFPMEFKINEHWSDKVEKGTVVPVLLHPTKRQVLLELNPSLLEEDFM